MNYKGILLAVKDMDKSVQFYDVVLGLKVIADFGANKTLTGGISLQTLDTWTNFIKTDKIIFGNNASELYFEESDFDDFIEKLRVINNIKYVHPVIEHSWGQRAVRIYDLDNHIIEVGEKLESVAKRFFSSGMAIEQIAVRMDIPLDYVEKLLK